MVGTLIQDHNQRTTLSQVGLEPKTIHPLRAPRSSHLSQGDS